MPSPVRDNIRQNRWRDFISYCVGTLILINAFLLYVYIDNSRAEAKSSEVTILHINDIYRIGGIDGETKGGLARVVWLRKDLERQGKTVIVTHGGDALAPSLLSDTYKGAKMIEILNLVAGDKSGVPLLFTIGNHEFDHGKCKESDPTKNSFVLESRIKESNFVWLDGNIDHSKDVNGAPCHGWTDSATVNKREAFVNIPVNGINLGFFGLTVTPGKNDENMPGNLKSNAEAAKDFVRALRPQSDFVIGLTHLDEKDDIAILNGPLMSAPDLVLGGHDHDYRACVDHAAVSGLKRLYKGTAEALDVVLVHIRKDHNGHVEYAQQRVSLDEHVQQDADTQQRIDAIMSEHQAAFCKDDANPHCLEEQIGTRQTTTEWILEEFSNRGQETVFGNWVARLMLETYLPKLPDSFCPDNVGAAALYLSGSLRLNYDLPAGSTVTRRILEETARYDSSDDPQQAMCVTGATAYAAIEHGLTQRFQGAWPHYTGLNAQATDDGKLKLVLLGPRGEIELTAASSDKVILIVPGYVAGGGDGYPIDESVVSERHVFAGSLTIKSILSAALIAPDGAPDPKLDWPDGRKAWGMKNRADACAM